MQCLCKVLKPMYEYNDKRYIDLDLSPTQVLQVEKMHARDMPHLEKPHKVIPLNGTKLKVKVPFRYNRIMCKITGLYTLYDAQVGDTVHCELVYCGPWTQGDYCGLAWKIKTFNLREKATVVHDE